MKIDTQRLPEIFAAIRQACLVRVAEVGEQQLRDPVDAWPLKGAVVGIQGGQLFLASHEDFSEGKKVAPDEVPFELLTVVVTELERSLVCDD